MLPHASSKLSKKKQAVLKFEAPFLRFLYSPNHKATNATCNMKRHCTYHESYKSTLVMQHAKKT